MEKKNKRRKLVFETYRWNITNFSKLDSGEHCSDKFIIDDHTWHIAINLNRNTDKLDISLEADKDCANLPEDWKKTADFNLALINQVNDIETIRKGFEFEFSADDDSYGFDLLTLTGLEKPDNGFIVNDSCIIEVGIFVTKNVDEKEDYESICNIDENPVKGNKYPIFGEMLRSSFEKIDRNFVPLLEEVCLEHPSLLASQENRSCRFREWAFTALGRFLHFLNTKKVKDMDEEAYNRLQILWDELQPFGFVDLSFLEYKVRSALRMKIFMVKAEVRRNVSALKNEIEDLKCEIEELKARFIERVKLLEIASKDLRKVEKIFGESTLQMVDDPWVYVFKR